jgi:SAM-dependent methyltransferase
MLKKTKIFLELIKRLGVYRGVLGATEHLFLIILSKIYKFDSWHAAATISNRPYRRTVADIVNELDQETVVEVGCGLGEILTRLNASEIYGYDIDKGVIRAARFLHKGRVKFNYGSLVDLPIQKIDVLILINWIHEISPAILEAELEPLLSRTRYLLLDALDPDVQGYKHDFQFLASRANLLSIIRPEQEKRNFHLFEVHL